MNSKTQNLIERPYQEVIVDILTAIIGGVVNEPIIFDLKIDSYKLAEPAAEVLNISGQVGDKQSHAFLPKKDYIFISPPDNAIIWQEGGVTPDDNTVFYVDYKRIDSTSPLDDLVVGSVTRTLGEAIGREIATVYQQINRAYLSAFVDTAEGKSLDLVVSILGIERFTKDYAIGTVTFFRNASEKGSITIPEGTLLTTSKGEVAFRTIQMRTLQQGQSRINVPIRADKNFKGEAGSNIAVGEITELSQPIAGIDRLTNFDSPTLALKNESDDELRARAKAALNARSKGTLAALKMAVEGSHASLAEVWEPNGPAAKRTSPGLVKLLVESKPGFFPGLQSAVEQCRAAGVRTVLVARYIYVKPKVEIYLKSSLPSKGKEKVMAEVVAAFQKYFDGLLSGDPARSEEMLKAVRAVKDVEDAAFSNIFAWRADTGETDSNEFVEIVMNALSRVKDADDSARRQVVAEAVDKISSLSPTEDRIADMSFVMDADGKQQATIEKIRAGKFQIVSKLKDNDDKWYLVLDMIEKSDLLLKYKES